MLSANIHSFFPARRKGPGKWAGGLTWPILTFERACPRDSNGNLLILKGMLANTYFSADPVASHGEACDASWLCEDGTVS